MKYFYTIALLFTLVVKAQKTGDVGKISLSVVMPENIENLDTSQLSRLESKISQIVTSAGISDSGYNNNIVIYPKLSLVESNVVEGGMQNLTVVTVDFGLFVKQVDSNILFSTISKTLKGSGTSKELAYANAISKIAVNDPEYQSFLDKSKTKIMQYYESRCGDIAKKAENLSRTQQYEQAIGLLLSVPEGVSCYSQVQAKAVEVYKALQKQNCARQLQLANNAMATKDYAGTLELLSGIDPASPCFQDSQKVAKSIESKLNAEQKKEWDFQMKQYNDEIALEKQRINAVKDIAVSYYKSQTSDINYTLIVK